MAQLEAAFAYRPRLIERIRRYVLRHATAVYLGTLSSVTVLIIAVLLSLMYRAGAGWPLLVVAALFALIPASDLALSVVELGRDTSISAAPAAEDGDDRRHSRRRLHDGCGADDLFQRVASAES